MPYVTDPRTGKSYWIDEDKPTNPLIENTIPVYSKDDYGTWIYNPDNTSGIPESTQNNGNQQSDSGSNAWNEYLRSMGIDPNAASGSGTSDGRDALYYTNYLNFLKVQEDNNLDLQNRKMDLEDKWATATDDNAKSQIENELKRIDAQIDQSKNELTQRTSEFNQTFGLNQQSFDWQKQYGTRELDLRQSQQALDEKNYLAQLAAKPINWLQYNQSANMPTVSQPFMEKLGGQKAGTVIAGQQYAQPSDINNWMDNRYVQQPSAPAGSYSPVNMGNQSTGYEPLTGLYTPQTQSSQQYNPQNLSSDYLQWNKNTSTQPVGTPNQMGLSTLTTPGMQTYARFTPTEKSLYSGYQQALTGDTEEDTQYRLRNRAAPGGGSSVFYTR